MPSDSKLWHIIYCKDWRKLGKDWRDLWERVLYDPACTTSHKLVEAGKRLSLDQLQEGRDMFAAFTAAGIPLDQVSKTGGKFGEGCLKLEQV